MAVIPSYTFVLLIPILIFKSQQVSMSNDLESEPELFLLFLRNFTEYTGASAVHFITKNNSDMGSLIDIIKNWTMMVKVDFYIDHESLTKDFHRYEAKSSVFILYSMDDDLVISIINKVKDENQTLNHVAWLIKKPKENAQHNIGEIPPSFRLFTFEFSQIKSISIIHLGFLYTDYQYMGKRISHKNIGAITMRQELQIKVPYAGCCFDLRGYGLNVVYVENDKPYLMVNKTGENSWEFSGIIGDVFSIIFEALGVRLKNVYAEPDNIYGGLDENNRPIGLFKQLHDKSADIALTGLRETSVRWKVGDLSIGIFRSSVKGIYREQQNNKTIWSFYYDPFVKASWILVSTLTPATLLAATVSLKALKNFSIVSTLLDLWGAINGQGTYEESQMRSISRKLYYLTALFLGMLLSFFYGSKLVANRSVMLQHVRFYTLEDVANDELYYPLVRKYTGLYDLFQLSSDREFMQVWNKIQTDVNRYTYIDMETGLRKMKEDNGVLIIPDIDIDYIKTTHKDYVVIDHEYGIYSNVVALQKHSPLTRIINYYILVLLEGGIITQCTKRYKVTEKVNVFDPEPQEIYFYEFCILIIFLSVSVVIVFLIYVFEVIHLRFKVVK